MLYTHEKFRACYEWGKMTRSSLSYKGCAKLSHKMA